MLNAKVIRKVQTNWPRVLNRAADKFLDDAGPFMVGEVKTRTPRDKGQLIGSINSRRTKDEVSIGTNVEYAQWVEYGSDPHPIESAVKIQDVGWRYIRMHPGTPAQPFLRPALDDNRKRLLLMFRDKLREVFRGRQS